MEAKIRAELENLRKMLQADGGDLELVALDGLKVQLRLKGACGSCPYATQTLKFGIERRLRQTVDPKIEVIQVS